jgi:hypothetical protein
MGVGIPQKDQRAINDKPDTKDISRMKEALSETRATQSEV